jgi:hypothetical protein
MIGQRLAGHSAARITRALNDAGVPCPSAADPGRNPHRAGSGWTLRTVAAILANPRYTGRQVWNRQPSQAVLVDPANTGLGHKQVQRWNLPEGWVISKHPAHAALVSEADFIAAQDTTAPRGPAGPAVRRYLLAGLIACGRCGRRLESAWSYGRPAYRCRHGYSSATVPDPARPKNAYVREDQILPHLAAIAILLAASAGISGPESGGSAQVTGPADGAVLIDRLRADGVVLTYDPDGRTLHAGGHDAPPVVIGKDATDTHSRQDRKRRTAAVTAAGAWCPGSAPRLARRVPLRAPRPRWSAPAGAWLLPGRGRLPPSGAAERSGDDRGPGYPDRASAGALRWPGGAVAAAAALPAPNLLASGSLPPAPGSPSCDQGRLRPGARLT